MKNFKHKNLFAILLASSVLFSCAKDDDDEEVVIPTTPAVIVDNADRTFTIGNTGASAYTFDFTSVENPELELIRGNTYEFKINTPGHPFLINTINTLGKNNTYDAGVTNNGAAAGTISFTIPESAPDLLWYNCEFHVPMAGRIRIVDKDSTRAFQVGNNGAAAYTFSGSGLTNVENPKFTFKRGKKYTFAVNSPGHPFLINTSNTTGTSNTYNDGVTNNGTTNGTISFTVPQNAPNILWYNCEFHSPMAGSISIID